MRYSGILVTTRPGEAGRVGRRLAVLPGVGVHQVDEATGRVVVVHEAREVEAHEAVLRSIQSTPGVWTAGLVRHADDGGPLPSGPPNDTASREGAR